MQRVQSTVLIALLGGCFLFPGSVKPRPEAHTCYRTTGPLLSPADGPAARWLMLTDSGGEAAAPWYDGRVVTGERDLQRVQWQSVGTGAIRVRWSRAAGAMEATETRGLLTGSARLGTQSWRVNALREDCPRDL